MIFLSLGTHEQPFDRAVDLVLAARTPEEPVVVQHGHTPARGVAQNVVWHDYLAHEEFVALIKQARVFVCHAGVGSIVTALTHGRTPVVIARERRFSEHVDDHQLQLATRLAASGLVVHAADELEAAMATAAVLRGHPRRPSPTLLDAVAVAASQRGGLLHY